MSNKVIFVGRSTPVPQLASSIVLSLKECDSAEIRSIGASAVSQSVKALAVARGILASQGRDLYFKIGFDTIPEGDNEQRTVMVFTTMFMNKGEVEK